MGSGLRSFSFYNLGIGKGIPSIELDPPPQDRILITLDVGRKGDPYGTSYPEMLLLVMLAVQTDAHEIFEFGTFLGQTTYNLALNVSGRIHTLALPSERNAKKAWEGRHYRAQIFSLHGDSSSFDFQPFFGQMDFVFVDGAHSYQGCLTESRVAFKLLKKNALIVWHDYNPCWPGVVRALNLLAKEVRLIHLRNTSFVIYRAP